MDLPQGACTSPGRHLRRVQLGKSIGAGGGRGMFHVQASQGLS